MALARGVQGATHTPQQITWVDIDGTPVDLTGATITGRIEDYVTGTSRNITGTLTITDADSGVFQWDYGDEDVEDYGPFRVQFIATYGGGETDISVMADWAVERAIQVV